MSDLIDRQAAIDALRVAYWDDNIQSAKDDPCIVDAMTDWAIRQVKALPSAQSERKTGRWIYGEDDVAMCDGYHCSECGFFVPWDYKRKSIDFIKDYNFCPNCGSPMEKEG